MPITSTTETRAAATAGANGLRACSCMTRFPGVNTETPNFAGGEAAPVLRAPGRFASRRIGNANRVPKTQGGATPGPPGRPLRPVFPEQNADLTQLKISKKRWDGKYGWCETHRVTTCNLGQIAPVAGAKLERIAPPPGPRGPLLSRGEAAQLRLPAGTRVVCRRGGAGRLAAAGRRRSPRSGGAFRAVSVGAGRREPGLRRR